MPNSSQHEMNEEQGSEEGGQFSGHCAIQPKFACPTAAPDHKKLYVISAPGALMNASSFEIMTMCRLVLNPSLKLGREISLCSLHPPVCVELASSSRIGRETHRGVMLDQSPIG